jgi:hypothetical protein
VIRAVAAVADRLLNLLAPPTRITPSPGWLSFAEQSREVWEKGELNTADCPGCFPEGWEDQLHDAVYDIDDDTLDPAPRPASSRGGAEPAGTGPLSPVPAGAPLHPAVIISRTFRELGVAVPAAAAEAVAIELTHFYDLTTKK